MEGIEISAAEFIRLLTKGGTPQNPKITQYVYEPGEIKHVKVTETIRISGRIFEHGIDIADCDIQGLYIKDCIFEKGFNIQRTSIKEKLDIDSSRIKGALTIGYIDDRICKLGSLRLYAVKIEDSIVISKVHIETDLTLFYLKVSQFASINDSTIEGELWISNVITSDLLQIDDCSVGKLKICSIADKMTVKVSETEFRELCFDGFTNNGYLQLINLMPKQKSLIQIENSSMGKYELIHCNFSTTKMIIYGSRIIDVFYTDTKFPDRLNMPDGFSQDDARAHEVFRDGYNQLKTIAQKQNDRKMFLQYQAAELSSYFKSIFLKEKPLTQIQLIAMWLSNNYGTSWGRGVLFVSILNLFFLSLYFSNLHLDLTKTSIITFCANYIDLLFLSLIKKPDFMIGNRGTIIFGVSRIFIAFGIYQTIAAFRKFGKSE